MADNLEPFPNPQSAADKPGRRKPGRKPGTPLNDIELAARRVNIKKAMAVRMTPEVNAVARLNALKHRHSAKHLDPAIIARLGEGPAEFQRHLVLLERAFIPEDEEERAIMRELAESIWQRLRLFHAEARWEKERLHRMLAEVPTPAQLEVQDTVASAHGLALALMEFEAFYSEPARLESQLEFWLRKLFRKRSHGKVRWKGFSVRRDRAAIELERDLEKEKEVNRFVHTWNAMSPEEQAVVRDEVQQKMDAKYAAEENCSPPSPQSRAPSPL